MVLLVQGQRVGAERLFTHPHLAGARQRFLAQPASLPEGAVPLVYAAQGEQAEIEGSQDAVLCSSDATTCVVVALVAAATDARPAVARITHHDTSTVDSLASLQQTVAGLGHQAAAKLWVAGAYADSRGIGARVTRPLLSFLQRCEAQLEVQLCCLGALNTAPDGSPRCTALTLDLSTLEARPAAPPPDQRGPLLPARLAQSMYSIDGAPAATSVPPLRSVRYTAQQRQPQQRQLSLTLLTGRPPQRALSYAASLLERDDDQLLQCCSTSPQHEPPHFVADMRAASGWVLQQAKGGPVRTVELSFTWVNGCWRPVEKAEDGAAAVAAAPPEDNGTAAAPALADSAGDR